MKSNFELEEVFRKLGKEIRDREDEVELEVEIPVRIKLLIGLQPIYNKNDRKVEIRLADKLYFGIQKHTLDCYYRGYHISAEYKMILLFVSKLGYDFSLTADQIEDFEVEY